MYTEFFGLKQKPFSIAPDPKFLYMSHTHKEALAHLVYGIREKSGFVIITGEAGTGKTTLVNALLEGLPRGMPKCVIKNPNITQENIYFLLGEAIGLSETYRNRNNISKYENRLKEIGGAALIVDEAQGLSIEMLEEIRLLSNLETPNQKLVHILLLGQQELNAILKSPILRQMKQRISVKFHLEPLKLFETHEYINHRLRIAGYEPGEKPLFPDKAIKEIYSQSKGFPRLINTLCDNSLLSAFTEDKKEITPSIIKKVAKDIEKSYGKESLPTKKRAIIYAFMGVLFLSAAIAGILFFPYTKGSKNDAIPENIIKMAPQKNTLSFDNDESSVSSSIPVSAFRKGTPAVKKIKPGKNSTVESIAKQYYGRISPEVLNAIKIANPGIDGTENFREGLEIVLPPLESIKSSHYSVCIAIYNTGVEARIVSDSLSEKGYASGVFNYFDEDRKQWFAVILGIFKTREEAEIKAGDLIGQGFFYAKPVMVSMEE